MVFFWAVRWLRRSLATPMQAKSTITRKTPAMEPMTMPARAALVSSDPGGPVGPLLVLFEELSTAAAGAVEIGVVVKGNIVVDTARATRQFPPT